MNTRISLFIVGPILAALIFAGCHQALPKHDIVAHKENLDKAITENIQDIITYAAMNNGNSGDSIFLYNMQAADSFYQAHQYRNQWSNNGQESLQADSLVAFLAHADEVGLIPSRYHGILLDSLLNKLTTDSTAKRDAADWARLDIWLTDGLMKIAAKLHYGVLPPDSINFRKNTAFSNITLVHFANEASHGNVQMLLDSLQPHYWQYHLLKKALQDYREKYAGRNWDTLPVNYKDTAQFQQQLANRLWQGGDLDSMDMTDPKKIKEAVKKFQEKHSLYPDGVAGKKTIAQLNISRSRRLQQIALNLERWRHFPDSLPEEYILVNIPGYELQLWDKDTLRIESKVIVGAPKTPTPVLNSQLINFITYPYWRVPFSIIVKEILPRLKRDTSYLRKERFEVIDRHNTAVDPATINWKRYSKNYFPFVLQQSEGLDNALGILKFNFVNKYGVYMHDTNARYLFGNSYRALSHGCVRVQQWKPLLFYLIKNDTFPRNIPDSVNVWLKVQKKRQVMFPHRVPLYFRYFTCMVKDHHLYFYEDIYHRDQYQIDQLERLQ